MASPITLAMKQIADEKNISYESVLDTVQTALAAAYRKDFGNKNQNIVVEFDPEKYDGLTGGIRVFDVKTVVEDMELDDEYFARLEAAQAPKKDEKGRFIRNQEEITDVALQEEFRFNPKTMIMISDARDLKPDAVLNEEMRVELSVPAAFGRMAAQTAKQVILQKLREAERTVIYSDFKGREGELMNVTVQRREGRIVLIDLGRATGVLLPEDQIESERYYPGTRLKALLRSVEMTGRGPEIRLSRTSPTLISALFGQEIPEVLNGTVEIRNIVREPGSRAKVAVMSPDDSVDPIGSCIGQRGMRIQAVIRELGGEKVDVVLWHEDAKEYIESSLSPARVISVSLDEDEHLATVLVPSDQLSLAIGKGGQNVRLAAKLTGWKITVQEEGGKAFDGTEPVIVAAEDMTEIAAIASGASDSSEETKDDAEDAEQTLEEEILEQTPTIAEVAPTSDES